MNKVSLTFLPALLASLCAITFSVGVYSQPILNYKPVITGLTSPVDIVNAGDGSNRLFIVQQNGIIKIYDQSVSYVGDFLTVTGIASGGERGLLSMAFHPDYKNNGYFFVYYTNTAGNIELARYKISTNPNLADPSSKVVIMTIPHPGQSNHNGGKLNFGVDGYLYFGTGDGGSGGDPPNNSQNGNVLLGKMLRIDVNHFTASPYYGIPTDNPFIKDSTVADEVWCIGLRNPWRWSFDRATHDMWIADVGQNAWEEINFRRASQTGGLNYGWRCYEGTHPYSVAGCQAAGNYTAPIFDYPHNNLTGGFSVTGGYVYRGGEYPALNGNYIFADYVSGNQWIIYPQENDSFQVVKQTGAFPANLASFGEGENGMLYAMSPASGIAYKIEAVSGVQFNLTDFSGIAKNRVVELNWSTSYENNLLQFEIEASTDSIHFQTKGIVAAKNILNGSSYTFQLAISAPGKIFYRLKIVGSDDKWDYSKTIALTVNASSSNFIYPSVVTTGTINMFLPDSYNSLEIFSMNGSLLVKKDITGQTGRLDVAVPALAKGIYLVKLRSASKTAVQKVFIR